MNTVYIRVSALGGTTNQCSQWVTLTSLPPFTSTLPSICSNIHVRKVRTPLNPLPGRACELMHRSLRSYFLLTTKYILSARAVPHRLGFKSDRTPTARDSTAPRHAPPSPASARKTAPSPTPPRPLLSHHVSAASRGVTAAIHRYRDVQGGGAVAARPSARLISESCRPNASLPRQAGRWHSGADRQPHNAQPCTASGAFTARCSHCTLVYSSR